MENSDGRRRAAADEDGQYCFAVALCRWGFNFDRHRFDYRNRLLRFDFLADRCNRVTHFRGNALQIVSGYPKPPSQDSNLVRVSQVNLVASGLRLNVAHCVSFDPDQSHSWMFCSRVAIFGGRTKTAAGRLPATAAAQVSTAPILMTASGEDNGAIGIANPCSPMRGVSPKSIATGIAANAQEPVDRSVVRHSEYLV
jgi:hypothetical protein